MNIYYQEITIYKCLKICANDGLVLVEFEKKCEANFFFFSFAIITRDGRDVECAIAANYSSVVDCVNCTSKNISLHICLATYECFPPTSINKNIMNRIISWKEYIYNTHEYCFLFKGKLFKEIF